MNIPEPPYRYPTNQAVDKLASRFNLPNTPGMQDWEYEVADPNRLTEFVAAYDSGELDDDERFTLMEIILQSFEDSTAPLEDHPLWKRALSLIDANIRLHIYTVWYWAAVESETEKEQWRVTPHLRHILEAHRDLLKESK